MKKNTLYILLCCVILSSSAAVNAENKFTAPFKSPFGLFSDKKEAPVEKTENLNLKVEETEIKKVLKPKSTKVFDPKNVVGVVYTENTINKAQFYIEEEDFESAELALASISEWVFDATEFHTDLFKTLNKLDNSEEQANIERDLAIKFAILRDRTLFLESKVLLNKGKQRDAVENLVEVVRSQPATDLGFEAYELLQTLGFTYKLEYEMINQ